MPDAHASGLIGRVRLIAAPALAFVVAVSGCFVFQNLNLSTVPRGPVTVETPVRVHMIDGSTVVFRKGARVTTDQVVGPGARFGLTLAESTMVDSVPLAQVLGMETYSNTVSVGKTVVVSTIATIVGTIAVAGIAVAIACASDPKCFGSCPTAYSDSAGTQVLEAEGFSYSIAPLFEMRDVDRLRVRRSSFYYHWARLIEILYALERTEQLLNDPDICSTDIMVNARPANAQGVGVIEAPRGTLFHHYWVDGNGRIEKVNLIVATGHNNLAMNRAVLSVAQKYVKGNELKEGMLNRVEAAIRCYDPCLSCSTHAVGQMPLHVQLIAADGSVLDELARG